MKAGCGFVSNSSSPPLVVISKDPLDVIKVAENQVHSQIAGGILI